MAKNIYVVTTARYVGTTKRLVPALQAVGIHLEHMPWDKFLAEQALPQGAWVLADFDRIHPWLIELAASRRDALVAVGMPVLNDPRRFLTRAPLIRTLHAMGINRYTCWLPAFGEIPTRFPVFLRSLAAHRGVITDLLHDTDEAAVALEQALAVGYTVTDLGFIEYRAAADPKIGHFQKHAAYRIGDRIFRALSVNDDAWMAKNGVKGLASEETYATELAEMVDYPHTDLIRQVTDICGCTYGRVDFGLVDGRPEIYEVNSNPAFGFPETDHPSPSRLATGDISKTQLVAAFQAIVPETLQGSLIDVSALKLWPRHKP